MRALAKSKLDSRSEIDFFYASESQIGGFRKAAGVGRKRIIGGGFKLATIK